jgi:hypothetical protein
MKSASSQRSRQLFAERDIAQNVNELPVSVAILKIGGRTRDIKTVNLSMDSNDVEPKSWSIMNSKLMGKMAPMVAIFKNFSISEFAFVSLVSWTLIFK